MTAPDLTKLSDAELASGLIEQPAHYAMEASRRLRLTDDRVAMRNLERGRDALRVRVGELEAECDVLRGVDRDLRAAANRIAELESQLAANSKSALPRKSYPFVLGEPDSVPIEQWVRCERNGNGGAIKAGDVVNHVYYDFLRNGTVEVVDERDKGWNHRVNFGRDGYTRMWCEAGELTRLPPEPAMDDARKAWADKLPERVAIVDDLLTMGAEDDVPTPEPAYTRLSLEPNSCEPPSSSATLTSSPPTPAPSDDPDGLCGDWYPIIPGSTAPSEPVADSKLERKYGGYTLAEWQSHGASPVNELAAHLSEVLAGVARIADCLDRDKSYPLAAMVAAQLRGLL